LLLKAIPSCFELKCRAYSLLSQCYHLVGAIQPQKQVLFKGLDLAASAGNGNNEYVFYAFHLLVFMNQGFILSLRVTDIKLVCWLG